MGGVFCEKKSESRDSFCSGSRTARKLTMKSYLGWALLLAQCFVTAAMTGMVWLVQVLVYPQFLQVSPPEFLAYHAEHSGRIGVVVAPLMILELGLALGSAWYFWRSPIRVPMVAGALLVAAIWLVTFLVQVPVHRALSREWSDTVIEELIAGNWARTGLWSARSLVLLWSLMVLPAVSRAPGKVT